MYQLETSYVDYSIICRHLKEDVDFFGNVSSNLSVILIVKLRLVCEFVLRQIEKKVGRHCLLELE